MADLSVLHSIDIIRTVTSEPQASSTVQVLRHMHELLTNKGALEGLAGAGVPGVLAQWVRVLSGLLAITSMAVGLPANLLVCWTVYKTKRLQTSMNALVVNLMLADLVSCSLCSPLTLLLVWIGAPPPSFIICRLLDFVHVLSGSVISLTMTSLAFERYQAISKPFNDKERISRIKVAVVGTWLLGLILSCISQLMKKNPILFMCTYAESNTIQRYEFGLYLFLPLCCMSFVAICSFYAKIFFKVNEHVKKKKKRGTILRKMNRLHPTPHIPVIRPPQLMTNKQPLDNSPSTQLSTVKQSHAAGPSENQHSTRTIRETVKVLDEFQSDIHKQLKLKDNALDRKTLHIEETLKSEEKLKNSFSYYDKMKLKLTDGTKNQLFHLQLGNQNSRHPQKCNSRIKRSSSIDLVSGETDNTPRQTPSPDRVLLGARMLDKVGPDMRGECSETDNTARQTFNSDRMLLRARVLCKVSPKKRDEVFDKALIDPRLLIHENKVRQKESVIRRNGDQSGEKDREEETSRRTLKKPAAIDVKIHDIHGVALSARFEGAGIVGDVCLMDREGRELGRRKVEHRMAQRAALIVLAFLICWTPLLLAILLSLLLDNNSRTYVVTWCEIFVITFSVALIAGLVNPVIYCMSNTQLRGALFRRVRGLRWRQTVRRQEDSKRLDLQTNKF